MSSAKTKPAPKSKPIECALAPVDNTLLANLCGPLDENIRQIETGFDVVIRRRNERFSTNTPTITKASVLIAPNHITGSPAAV